MRRQSTPSVSPPPFRLHRVLHQPGSQSGPGGSRDTLPDTWVGFGTLGDNGTFPVQVLGSAVQDCRGADRSKAGSLSRRWLRLVTASQLGLDRPKQRRPDSGSEVQSFLRPYIAKLRNPSQSRIISGSNGCNFL